MQRRAEGRAPGFLPAAAAAAVAFATTAVYVGLIAAQGDGHLVPTVAIATYIVGLGACALAGGLRSHPDRVIWLGVATGGLVGGAVISLFSIGVLLLAAGILAAIAWMRSGVAASSREQLLGGIGGVVAAIGFLAVAFLL